MGNLRISIEDQERDPFYIPDGLLGRLKNFNRKYLTLKTPETREEAQDFSLKMNKFVKSMAGVIWELNGIYQTERIRDYFTQMMVKYEDLKCQALRRSLIYGVLYRFKQYQKLYEHEGKNWRYVGFTVVEILKIVNELIPEVYFENELLLEEAVNFAKDMNEFVAFAWKIDFAPLFNLLKEMNYASIDNPEPLRILIKKGEYMPALKMILMKEASLNPNVNLLAWKCLVEVPDSDNKIQFVSNLIRLKLLDVNWKVSQGEGIDEADLITLAMNSQLNHYKMIMLLLSVGANKLKRPLNYYYEYVNDALVSCFHSELYHKKLVAGIRDLISHPDSEDSTVPAPPHNDD